MCPSRELSDKNPFVWRPWEQRKKLQSHIAPISHEIHNNASTSSLQCSICYTSFKRDSELKRHKNSKHLSKREQCTICGKIFTRKDNLTRHIKAHNSEDKPSCRFCRKPLSRRDAVQRHESRCPKNSSRKSNKQQQQISPTASTLPQESSTSPFNTEDYDGADSFPTHLERLSLKHPKLTVTISDSETDEEFCDEDDEDVDVVDDDDDSSLTLTE